MAVVSQDWSEFVDRLTHNYGAAYDPKRNQELRPKLVRLLTRELADVEREDLVAALDKVLRRTRVILNWDQFVCTVFSWLPGSWTKLTNNPGFAASTMLLLTDGTVMCQQAGGLYWKKLTPDSQGFYVNGTWNDLAPMHWTRRYYHCERGSRVADPCPDRMAHTRTRSRASRPEGGASARSHGRSTRTARRRVSSTRRARIAAGDDGSARRARPSPSAPVAARGCLVVVARGRSFLLS